MTAVTGCEEKVVTSAWGDSYPFQVRVSWDKLYRTSSSEFPRIENIETLSDAEFQRIVEYLQEDGERLVIPEWGSRTAALTEDAVPKPGVAEIKTARAEILSQLEDEPPDTEPVAYTPGKQIARDEAFRRAVLEAYGERCAFCGVRRQTPDGRPEVEAAHVRPKAEGGPDDIRNGIALCKLHHWAFDNSWLSITTEYEISVTDAPDRDGYGEFTALDGREIWLPDDERMHPSPKYLQ